MVRSLAGQYVVVLGPTAGGKTQFAHDLAAGLAARGQRAVLINLDAYQVFRGLEIGTAKPLVQDRTLFSYELLDRLEPHERVDAATFGNWARAACEDAWQEQALPIAVGGSGLYGRAFLHGLDALPVVDPAFRADVRLRAAAHGWPALHEELRRIDPVRSLELHPNDGTRIERALEICALSGRLASEQMARRQPLSQQPVFERPFVVHLQPDSDSLRSAIQRRTEALFRAGWIAEVRMLLEQYGPEFLQFQSAKALGYREIANQILNSEAMDELPARIETVTWQYSRRQKNWNRQELCHASVRTPSDAKEILTELITKFAN